MSASLGPKCVDGARLDPQGEATAPDFSLFLLVAAFGWLDQQREQSLQLRPVLEPDAQGEATAPGFLLFLLVPLLLVAAVRGLEQQQEQSLQLRPDGAGLLLQLPLLVVGRGGGLELRRRRRASSSATTAGGRGSKGVVGWRSGDDC
ncbi:hypothetical protein PF003_g6545 [Phytophthora fragariae]|nr:hypothetical protein PF003_g6545 [Phytophthora fragariae]